MRHKVVVVMLSPHIAATRNLDVLTLQHCNFAEFLCWTLYYFVLYSLLQVHMKIIKIKVGCKVQNTKENLNLIM